MSSSLDSVQLVKQILVDEITKQVHLGSSSHQWNDQEDLIPVPEDQEACKPLPVSGSINRNVDIIKNKLEQKSAKPNDIITQWARISKKNNDKYILAEWENAKCFDVRSSK